MSTVCFNQGMFAAMIVTFLIVIAVVGFMNKTQIVTETKFIPSPMQQPIQIPVPVPIDLQPVQQPQIARPLNTGPERVSIPYKDTSNFYEVGYVQSNTEQKLRMRLFARRKYANSDKFEYYVMDKESIKMPLKTERDIELFENDSVTVAGSLFTVHVYDVSSSRFQA